MCQRQNHQDLLNYHQVPVKYVDNLVLREVRRSLKTLQEVVHNECRCVIVVNQSNDFLLDSTCLCGAKVSLFFFILRSSSSEQITMTYFRRNIVQKYWTDFQICLGYENMQGWIKRLAFLILTKVLLTISMRDMSLSTLFTSTMHFMYLISGSRKWIPFFVSTF